MSKFLRHPQLQGFGNCGEWVKKDHEELPEIQNAGKGVLEPWVPEDMTEIKGMVSNVAKTQVDI